MNIAGKHGWNDLEDYLHVILRVAESHPFVVEHHLEREISPEAGKVSGDILCHGDIVLNVDKHFEIRRLDNRRQARTTRYSYHAQTKEGKPILRYDNAHCRQGHPTHHHKHDWLSEEEEITHVGANWPHLSEVLDELRDRTWK